MRILFKLLKGFGRLVFGLVIFIVVAMVWTGLLFVVNPWSSARSGEWPDSRPIAVTSGATNTTRVILFRNLAEETKVDASLVPWPATSSGSNQVDHGDSPVHTTWKTVSGKLWQFEVSFEDRDHLLESRYRLEGETPVLVESRGRDPGLGFLGVILAVISLIVWRMAGWWRSRMAATIDTLPKPIISGGIEPSARSYHASNTAVPPLSDRPD
jgi:hypothetical protein